MMWQNGCGHMITEKTDDVQGFLMIIGSRVHNNMLLVSFRQRSSQIPPFFLKVDEAVLVATAQELTLKAYNHFRTHLSPFVTPQHLQLHLSNGQLLFKGLPLFLYFDYGKHMQEFWCEVEDLDAVRTKHQPYQEPFLSLLLRVSHRGRGHGESKVETISKGNEKAVTALAASILPTDRVYITGKRITLKEDGTWSDLLLRKWDSLANVRDRCLYVCLDRA